VEREQRAGCTELHPDRRLVAADQLEAPLAEPLLRPARSREHLFGRRLRLGIEREHERVRVPQHYGTPELGDPLGALERLRAALERVPQTDELVDGPALEVLEHRLERHEVAVDVREDRGQHC
jgi:hypothetical protein